MTTQPTPPASPAAPALSDQSRAAIVQGAQAAAQAGRDAAQQARELAQTAREQAQAVREQAIQAGGSGNTSVLKDAGGRIVVNGPDGKTITIDPKAGLDGDQIQEMVQTALQPTKRESSSGTTAADVGLAAILISGLLLLVWMFLRMRGQRAAATAGPAALSPDAAARLARIEQAVEAVAIEVERISEAQRYSAQLLTDRLPGAGQPLPAIARTLDTPAARG